MCDELKRLLYAKTCIGPIALLASDQKDNRPESASLLSGVYD